jgi:hypothetical protein
LRRLNKDLLFLLNSVFAAMEIIIKVATGVAIPAPAQVAFEG